METLQSYAVAESCIEAGVNYCDLADCRTFVNGISVLDARAREAGVAILSGCNSVPTLSSAIIDEQRHHFKRIDSIEHGISSSAKTPGLSTIEGGLAYTGKPIRQLRNGQVHEVMGWCVTTGTGPPGCIAEGHCLSVSVMAKVLRIRR